MIPRDVLERLDPQPVAVSLFAPLRIDEEHKVLLIQQGHVEVAYSGFRKGRPVGVRLRLGRLGRGRLVLCVPQSAEDARLRIFLLPSRDAVVAEIPWTRFTAEWARDAAALAPSLSAWMLPFAVTFAEGRDAHLPRIVREAGALQLAAGESVAARRDELWWARVHTGRLSQNGSEVAVVTAGARAPIGQGLWLRAEEEPAHLELSPTRDLDAEELAAGMRRLIDQVLAELYQRHRKEAAQDRRRLRARLVQDRVVRDRAVQRLSEVFHEDLLAKVYDDALYGAACAVGAELGVSIRPAVASEDRKHVKDPLEAIARASRIRTRPVTLYGDWWRQDAGPLIAYREDDERRPVALLRRRRHYVAYDAARGETRPVDAAVAEQLSPHATMLYPALPERPLTPGDLFRGALARRRKELLWILGMGVVATLLGMVIPQATGLVVDRAIPDGHRALLRDLSLCILAAALGQVVFRLTQAVLLTRVGVIASAETQSALWDRLLRLRPSFFRRYSSGDLQSRVMAATEISHDLNGVVLSSLITSLLALLNVGLMAYYSLPLTALALGVAGIAAAGAVLLGQVVRRHARSLIEWEGRLFGTVVQFIQGVSKLRVSGAEHRAYEVWATRYAHALKLRTRMQGAEDWLGVLNQVLPTLSTLLLFAAGFRLLSGPEPTLSLGRFLAFQAAYAIFLTGMISLSGTVVGVLDTMAKGRRLLPILETPPEVDDSKTDPGRLRGSLRLQHVHFRYRSDGPKVLEDVSLAADPGDFIGLVGPSGCGKSTILRLLLGFEQAQAGHVQYDGQELAGLDVVAVRRQIGVVLQSGHLSSGSIFRNIGAGHDVTLDEAWEAAEAAGIADEIRAMPMGMHTVMQQGGGSVSGGQRQRLLIARALVHKPRILLFDEATSALDNRTQQIVSERLDRLQVTRVVVAHRLSTIRGAHRIYVLDQGRVVQQGTYEELIAQEGLFARMAVRQRV